MHHAEKTIRHLPHRHIHSRRRRRRQTLLLRVRDDADNLAWVGYADHARKLDGESDRTPFREIALDECLVDDGYWSRRRLVGCTEVAPFPQRHTKRLEIACRLRIASPRSRPTGL